MLCERKWKKKRKKLSPPSLLRGFPCRCYTGSWDTRSTRATMTIARLFAAAPLLIHFA
jgi:hypothetical protein